MSNANFASILDRPASEIERPKPLPIGTYLTIIKGLPRYDKSSKKQTDFVEFTHEIIAAADDVDEALLQEAGGLTLKDGTPRMIKNSYYLTDDAGWRLRKFLEDCGFDFSDGKTSMRDAVESTPNCEVHIMIKHEASQDGRTVFARIADTASASEE